MSSTTFVLLSGTLSFGVPLLLALLELRAIRPSSGGGGGDEPPPPVRPAPRPLPDCLLPAPVIVRNRPAIRQLEDA